MRKIAYIVFAVSLLVMLTGHLIVGLLLLLALPLITKRPERISKRISLGIGSVNNPVLIIKDVLEKYRGKILQQDGKSIKAKFGNRIMIRLFGTAMMYDMKGKPLPAIIDAEIIGEEVVINMTENMGWILWLDPIGKNSYNKFFQDIETTISTAFEKQ